MKGAIRIIGGRWRGRKIPVIDQPGLRPTTDRVKETLFNWLMPIIQDSICLDCFSGSGSLGFDAASRGAKQVVLLEKEKQAALQLRKNKQILTGGQPCADDLISIYHTDALNWLQGAATMKFNLVFIDPPFYGSLIEETLKRLERYHWLANLAYIYIESEINNPILSFIPEHWHLHREKIAGQVHSYLFIREIK